MKSGRVGGVVVTKADIAGPRKEALKKKCNSSKALGKATESANNKGEKRRAFSSEMLPILSKSRKVTGPRGRTVFIFCGAGDLTQRLLHAR